MATSKDNITVLCWIDKRIVHMISSYAGAEPFDEILRYDKKEKTKIPITRPFCIQEYNKCMGGVDFMDCLISIYLITILTALKTKNGTFEYFFNFLILRL
jgi:hypothetical protein